MFHSFEDEADRDKGRAAIYRVRELERVLRNLLKSGRAGRAEATKVLAKKFDAYEERWLSPEEIAKSRRRRRKLLKSARS